jgi:hypothetical protein
VFDPRKARQRSNTLNTIKGAIDSAKFAITSGDIVAHEEAMGTVRSFLAAYDAFPALVSIDAPVPVVEETATFNAPFLGDDPGSAAQMSAVAKPKK